MQTKEKKIKRKREKDADIETSVQRNIEGRSNKARKKRKKEQNFVQKTQESPETGVGPSPNDIYNISCGDKDCSKGMKKWITQYRESRPRLNVLQQQINDFITFHEEKLERERKEREARVAEGGWIVVVHHKDRKKTIESENRIVVGSVDQAAVEDKMAKKCKEIELDFYYFQKKETQRHEIIMLQRKFEEDKKRLQQLRAARKFRPY